MEICEPVKKHKQRLETLDHDEQLQMIRIRKQMTLLYKIMFQWRLLAKKGH